MGRAAEEIKNQKSKIKRQKYEKCAEGVPPFLIFDICFLIFYFPGAPQ